MAIKGHKYTHRDAIIERQNNLYQGFFSMTEYSIRHRLFDGGWSQPHRRELFRRGNAVGVLLYDPLHDLVGMVEQFRIGAHAEGNGPWQYEVVAGMVKEGESECEVARRELLEEAGVQVRELISIADYLVSGGGSDEKFHLFCGLTDLSDAGGHFGLDEEDEDILFHVWSYQEAVQALEDNLLNNAATTMAMFWLQLNRTDLRTQEKK